MDKSRFALLALLISGTAHAAPPPLLPPGYPDLPNDLTSLFNSRNLTELVTNFSDSVIVIEDGKESASDKRSLQALLEKWVKYNWVITPVASAQGGDETLVMERVANPPPVPLANTVSDCCWWTRAVKYRIDSHYRIDRMTITNAFSASNIKTIPQRF